MTNPTDIFGIDNYVQDNFYKLSLEVGAIEKFFYEQFEVVSRNNPSPTIQHREKELNFIESAIELYAFDIFCENGRTRIKTSTLDFDSEYMSKGIKALFRHFLREKYVTTQCEAVNAKITHILWELSGRTDLYYLESAVKYYYRAIKAYLKLWSETKEERIIEKVEHLEGNFNYIISVQGILMKEYCSITTENIKEMKNTFDFPTV